MDHYEEMQENVEEFKKYLKMTMDLYTSVTDFKSASDIEKTVPGKTSKVIGFKGKTG